MTKWFIYLMNTQNQFSHKEPHSVMLGHKFSPEMSQYKMELNMPLQHLQWRFNGD